MKLRSVDCYDDDIFLSHLVRPFLCEDEILSITNNCSVDDPSLRCYNQLMKHGQARIAWSYLRLGRISMRVRRVGVRREQEGVDDLCEVEQHRSDTLGGECDGRVKDCVEVHV